MPGAWTFVLVTDRKELDDQLHRRFVDSDAVPQQSDVHARNIDHLRELLAADHRYVFTLIQKFQLTKLEREAGSIMPILSERDDIIVMTDEAHRTQYDELALNMRTALPNAAFMGFTGTPLVVGEELTRREFGKYVSIYNFRDSITDGATVPLYYENRTPELQLTNARFGDELDELLQEAEIDDEAEARLSSDLAESTRLSLESSAYAWSPTISLGTSLAEGSRERRCTSASIRPLHFACMIWYMKSGQSYLAELIAQRDASPS